MGARKATDDDLDELQRQSFAYFVHETDPARGLTADNSQGDSPWSIASTGFALSCYPVAVERGFLPRSQALARTLAALRFFHESPQGPEPDAAGYRGFYYHFLDRKTGRRAGGCELSTIDSAMLFAGMLTAARYFDLDTADEREVRELADALYRRADWRWAQAGGDTVSHGWRPEGGFLTARWQGYSEGLLLYALGLGSPTYPLPEASYPAWASTYQWKALYGYELLYAGPLFIHHLPHVWIDFREIQDDYMRGRGINYFENSRRATYVQREYAVRNPRGFEGYGENCWGITASDGPGPETLRVQGVKRRFLAYHARGVPYGPDDGTLAPWAVVASLPFAPEIVLPAVRCFNRLRLRGADSYGFKCTFNPTYPKKPKSRLAWVSPRHYGINQGPVVLMIENYRSGLIWRLLRRCPYLVTGLRRAGFTNGWLPTPHTSPKRERGSPR